MATRLRRHPNARRPGARRRRAYSEAVAEPPSLSRWPSPPAATAPSRPLSAPVDSICRSPGAADHWTASLAATARDRDHWEFWFCPALLGPRRSVVGGRWADGRWAPRARGKTQEACFGPWKQDQDKLKLCTTPQRGRTTTKSGSTDHHPLKRMPTILRNGRQYTDTPKRGC